MAEQRRTDRAAWEGEMFRLLAENVKDYAIFVVGPDRHVLSWSKGAERLLGFTEEEIVGRPCDCFFTPEDVRAGVPQRELEQALATGRGEDDRWHVRKDGTRFWSSGAVTPLRDEAGRLHGFAKIMRDRTELKLAEEAAYERARQLQFLTDHAPVLIAHCDAGRRFKFVNKPYAARFNLHPQDIVGRQVRAVLEMGGHEVREAADGDEGLRAYHQRPADLVLCDLCMPGRGAGDHPELHAAGARVVVSGGVTTGGADCVLKIARALGTAGALAKPVGHRALLGAVEAALEAA